MFMLNTFVYFQFDQITFIYLPYLFLIRSLGPPCIQINAHDAYDLRFGCFLYAWKDKEVIFLMQQVSCSIKIGVAGNHKNKIVFSTPRNAIFHFHKT
jgi:hypothetical protein